jgi:hypothetical protein
MFTRPKTVTHAILGRYKLWLHSGGRARVGRFQDVDGVVFYAQVRREAPWGLMWDMISRHRKLSAAKRAVEDYLTRNGANDERRPKVSKANKRSLSANNRAEMLLPAGSAERQLPGMRRHRVANQLRCDPPAAQKLVALLRDGCPPSRSLARSQC